MSTKAGPTRAGTREGEQTQRSRLPVLAKYLLLEVPGWVFAAIVLALLVHYWDLESRTALLLFGLWVLKDFALYPVLRIAYEDGPTDGTASLIGAEGIVKQSLDPEGWIRIGSELWRAEVAPGAAPVESGAKVRIVEVRGLVLRVEPV